jgi:hypothetical protein
MRMMTKESTIRYTRKGNVLGVILSLLKTLLCYVEII